MKGYIRLYDAQLRTERKAAKTIEVCSYVLGKFEQWFAGEYGRPALLADFRSEQARSFMVAVQDKPKWEGHPTLEGVTTAGISGATLHLYVRMLKTFTAWLAREGCVPADPVETLRLPRVDQKQLQPLTEEEERRLIGAYDDNNPVDCRVKAIFLLMLDTGIRRGEVITLKDGNVDLDHSFLLVMGTGRKERSVPFGYTTEKVLRKYATFFRPDPAAPRSRSSSSPRMGIR